MDISVQRKIDRHIGTMICRLLSLFTRRQTPVTVIEPRNILIILLSEMGSLVLARPMVDRIRSTYPRAAIYALVFEQNREILELIDLVPGNRIITIRNTAVGDLLQDSLRAVAKMRRIGIDTVIDCELFSRISSILSLLSGGRLRVGFHPYNQEGLYRGGFINRPVLYNPYQHIAQQFITLADAITARDIPTVKRVVDPLPPATQQVAIDRIRIDDWAERLKSIIPEIAPRRLILLYPGGGMLPIRAWPPEHYGALASALTADGMAVGIIGLASDRPLAEDIVARSGSPLCVDLTGRTASVRELLTLFHLADLLITNDGGPGHFASLTPLATIMLFGPETPVLYGPLAANAFAFHTPLSCSPCLTAYNHRNSPCNGDNQCLQRIRPEDVLAKAYELLQD